MSDIETLRETVMGWVPGLERKNECYAIISRIEARIEELEALVREADDIFCPAELIEPEHLNERDVMDKWAYRARAALAQSPQEEPRCPTCQATDKADRRRIYYGGGGDGIPCTDPWHRANPEEEPG